MFATEFQSIKPTPNFNRAVEAAEREANQRHGDSAVFEDGKRILIVHPQAEAFQAQ